MKKRVLSGVITCYFLLHSLMALSQEVPFGSNDSYAHGMMQSYESNEQADALTQSWYNYWEQNFTLSCGGGKVLAINGYNSSEAYSEGQGYGLLLAAYMGDKTLFDGLWEGYKQNKNQNGVMDWRVSCNGTVSANGATDGDLDAAMGLLVAHKQWPDAGYGAEATTLINDIQEHEFTNCNGKIVQKPGDMFGGCDCTNPSYYAIGYYRAFAQHVSSEADAAFWQQAADDGLDLLLTATHPTTGLNPAWTDESGSITSGGNCNVAASGGGTKTDYQFDAARTPWRVVVDYLWWGTPKSKEYLEKVCGWVFNEKGIENVVAGMTTSGSNNVNYKNSSFTGAFAIGAMGTDNQTMLNEFYEYWTTNSVTSGNVGNGLDDNPYFQNALRTMYIFVASGNFWNPYATSSNDNQAPSVSLTAPSSDITACAGEAVTLTASADDPDGNISQVEFLRGSTVISTVTSSPYTYSWTPSDVGTYNITARATDDGGATETSASVEVTIRETPLPEVTTPVNYCQGETASQLTATGASLKWYTQETGGTASAIAPTPNTANTGSVSYWVTQTIDGCESPRAEIEVNVGTPPSAPTVSSPVTYCQWATATALTAQGADLLWYTSETGGSASSSAPVPSTSATGTTTYYVTQSNNGCESERTALTVTVNPSPETPVVSSPVVYDIDEEATALTAEGDNLVWYTSETGGTGSSQAPVPNTSQQGTTTYYVASVGSNGCESPRASIDVTVASLYKVYKVSTAPEVDGVIDEMWDDSKIAAEPVENSIQGTVSGADDLSATYRLLWDDDYLYVLGDVTDDATSNDSQEPYNDDAVELFFDINNAKTSTYESDDAQYTFGWNDGTTITANPESRSTANMQYVIVDKSDGYIFEARIPWATIQATPELNQLIGFDFMVNDDDGGDTRDGKLSWNAATDDAWENPSLFGTIILTDNISSTVDKQFLDMQIYPNPASSQINIRGLNSEFDYKLIDNTGKVVAGGNSEEVINIQQLQSGTYQLIIISEGHSHMTKIIKAN